MKYIRVLGTMGVVSGILLCMYGVSQRSVEADPLDAMLTLAPAPAVIHQELAARGAERPPMPERQRQDLFAARFTERFRRNEAKMAVLARFEEVPHAGRRIKLMCPARLEPWNMDRIALSAWREAQDDLGQAYDVDIYATYIAMPARKVGELRVTRSLPPLNHAIANIHYLQRSEPDTAAASAASKRHAMPAFYRDFPRRSLTPAELPGVFTQH